MWGGLYEDISFKQGYSGSEISSFPRVSQLLSDSSPRSQSFMVPSSLEASPRKDGRAAGHEQTILSAELAGWAQVPTQKMLNRTSLAIQWFGSVQFSCSVMSDSL